MAILGCSGVGWGDLSAHWEGHKGVLWSVGNGLYLNLGSSLILVYLNFCKAIQKLRYTKKSKLLVT